MLKYYFRETFAGRLINILSEDRLLKAPQPEIPAQVTTDIDTAAGDVRNGHLAPTDFELKPSEKSSRMLFDDPTPAGGGTEIAQLARGLSQPNSSSPLNATTPPEKDIEGGNHQYLVGWNGDNDPENPRNWPMWLKVWSTSMISFLTFAIYIGSAIYTTGIEGVNEQFHVSRVVSTLGLSLFVLGYGVVSLSNIEARISDQPLTSRTVGSDVPRPVLRSTPYRSNARLHPHAPRLHRPAIPRHLRPQHRHPPHLPLPFRLHRLPRPRHRSRLPRGPLHPQKAPLRRRNLGK